MELVGFEPNQFLSCGIDAKAVRGVQILKYLSSDVSAKVGLEDIKSCSNTIQPEQQEKELSSDNVVEITKKSVLMTGFLLGFQVMDTEATDLLTEKTLNHLEKCAGSCLF
uniref:Uncharacterized protein n=1 Tax=Ditylenchus dipsaci TaxID=166011 RepID=A0A915E4V3_9BILA